MEEQTSNWRVETTLALVTVVTALIPFFSAFLYFAGKIYSEGMARYWFLDDGMFERSLSNVLMQSGYALVALGLDLGLGLVLAITIIMAVLLVLNKGLVWVVRLPIFRNRRRLDSTRNVREMGPVDELLRTLFLVTGFGIVAAYLFLAFALLIGHFGTNIEKLGFEASQSRHIFLDHKSSRDQLLRTYVAVTPSELEGSQGLVVDCVESKCIFLNANEVVVLDVSALGLRSSEVR